MEDNTSTRIEDQEGEVSDEEFTFDDVSPKLIPGWMFA